MPPNVPRALFELQGKPFFGFKGPPLELLAIELIYFIVVTAICLIIYFKAREIYKISQHRGVYYFKNIFLYFALSYIFRFVHISFLLSEESFSLNFSFFLMRATMFLVGYFSTMAILSLSMAVAVKNAKVSVSRKVPWVLHGIALVLSVLTALPRSNYLLTAMQTFLLLGSLAVLFLRPAKARHGKLLSQNRVTYLLLAVFWIVNSLALTRRLLPIEAKVPLYVLSVAVFISIFLRVEKRLPSNAKKKRQA